MMGFLKKKKSSQASPSQGGKHLSIISTANASSSVFARSPSSATIDDSRNDVGSDGRSVANSSIADVNITASKATMRQNSITVNTSTANNNNATVASPLSATPGAGKEVRDKPSSAATVATPSAVVAAAACPTIIMPPLLVPQSQPTASAKKKTTKEEQKKPHQRQPPNKSEKQKQASKRGDTKLNKMRLGELPEVGSSYSSQSMSYDERETFSEYDDDDERTEESAIYTDDSSNSFVSLGYKTSHSESLAFSRTSSSENTDSASTTEEDDDEERRDSNRFDPESESATSPTNRSSKAKKALKQLNNLATKAKKESTSIPSRTPVKEKSISRAITPHKKVTTASDSVVSADASSKASVSTAMFIKTMEEYTVKNTENQLLLTVNERGNVQKLSLQEFVYIPNPNKSTDVVIKVDCSTITLQDCMIRRGQWYVMENLPFVPGADVVGTVISLGAEAAKNSTFQIGDKVASIVLSGGNAKYITVHYQSMIRVPSEIDNVTALSILSTYVPARESLDLARKFNTPLTGANVLIIGGNGPSGLAMIELALLEAANVYTTADDRHHDYLTKLGVQCFPIDPEKWMPSLKGKMDVVLDSVCIDMYESSQMALNATGTLVCTGMSAVYTMGHVSAFGLHDIRDYKAGYCKMKAKYFMYNGVYYDKMERFNTATIEVAQHFRYLCHLACKGTIKPIISTCVPLKRVASVQRAIELGETAYGVCVCRPWADEGDAASSKKVAADSEKASSN